MKQIPLTRGLYAIMDSEDFVRISRVKWFASPNGNTFYALRHPYNPKTQSQSTEAMHRIITGVKSGQSVDHKNGNGLDNRKNNLRLATTSQNGANRRKNVGVTSSPFKGVTWHRHKQKWMASLKVCGKTLFLGYWNTQKDAARAYDSAAHKYFDSYARTNF